ncbi:MAG: fasciclin domain-containing protein [Bacteroidetes bacterium]|nr:fasciclin domain-containing protein [Bacteroidota bacterium]
MKNVKQFTSYIALVAVIFSLWIMSGCSKSSDVVPTKTLVDLIAQTSYQQSATVTDDKALDSLVKYLSIYPDLVTLLGAPDKYTLFAPSNKAFKNLLATPGFPTNIKKINPAIIQGVLYYHIVADQKLQASLTSGLVLNSLYTDPLSPSAAQTITINADFTLKTGSSNQSIHITLADQKAINGVFHITESVLIPPSIGSTLTPILGTVAGTILLGADFTDLATIISKADNGFAESAPNLAFKVSTWLAMPIATSGTATANAKGITFFAVPNAVFKAAATAQSITEAQLVAALSTTSDAARGFLLNHLVTTGQYTVADAPASNPNGITKFTSGTIVPKSGATKTITVSVSTASSSNPYGVAVSNNPTVSTSFAPIVSKDIAHSNGQAQVIGGMLK